MAPRRVRLAWKQKFAIANECALRNVNKGEGIRNERVLSYALRATCLSLKNRNGTLRCQLFVGVEKLTSSNNKSDT